VPHNAIFSKIIQLLLFNNNTHFSIFQKYDLVGMPAANQALGRWSTTARRPASCRPTQIGLGDVAEGSPVALSIDSAAPRPPDDRATLYHAPNRHTPFLPCPALLRPSVLGRRVARRPAAIGGWRADHARSVGSQPTES
jgi:hypothetical protein